MRLCCYNVRLLLPVLLASMYGTLSFCHHNLCPSKCLQCHVPYSEEVFSHILTVYSIDTHFDVSTTFGNIVVKGEIAHKEQFLLFPQCFLFNQIIVSPFVHNFDLISSFAAELEEPKIDISGRGVNPFLNPLPDDRF